MLVVMMTAAATLAVLVMMVVVFMGVGMVVTMGMIVVMMLMAVMMMTVAVVVSAIVDAALGLERALDGGRRAALPAHQFGHRRIVLDINRIRCDFSQGVTAAEVPGEAREPQGVLSLDFQERLRRCLHLDEAPIVKPESVAVVENRVHFEIGDEGRAFLTRQMRMTLTARRVIQCDLIDDTVGFHGGLANDDDSAGHEISRKVRMRRISRL